MFLCLIPLLSATPPDPDATVVVTASRAEHRADDLTATVEVIDAAAIEASGAGSLAELLRVVPGVQIVPTYGGEGLVLGGLDPQHTLVLVNGRPVAGRVDGTMNLDRIRLDDVERVEILRGPGSALYGSEALGGVINVITRQSGSGIDAELRAGGIRLAEAGLLAPRGHAMAEGAAAVRAEPGPAQVGLSVDGQHLDGYDLDPSDPATTGDTRWTRGVSAYGELPAGTHLTLSGDAAYQQQDRRGVSALPTGAVFDDHQLEESVDAELSLGRWTGGDHQSRAAVSTTLWRQQLLSNQRASDVQDTYEETVDRRFYLNLSHQRVFGGVHAVMGGADGSMEQLRSARLADDADRRRLGLYVQDDWRVSTRPRFSIAPGVRLDLDSQFGVHPTPHLALRLDPTPRLRLSASGGTGYRAPDFKELYLRLDHSAYGYVVEGNPALRPETSVGLDSGARWERDHVGLGISGFYHHVDDLIQIELDEAGDVGQAASYHYVNIAQARTRGGTCDVRLSTEGRAPLLGTLAYTFTDASDLSSGVLLDGRARHRLVGTLTATPGPMVLSVRVERVGARPFTDDAGGTTEAAPYTWIDGRLAVDLSGSDPARVQLEVGARNLLDSRDLATLGLPPRVVYAGLDISQPFRSGSSDRPAPVPDPGVSP